MELIIGILEEGFIYALVSFGAYITFKILDFPDMTVDGTFPFGMCITAVMIINGVNPFLTLPVSFLAGCIAGAITGLIHVKLKVRDLLSGIIVMTSLYSINLRMAGKANLPFFSKVNIFKIVSDGETTLANLINRILPSNVSKFIGSLNILDILHTYNVALVLLVIVLVLKVLLDKYLETKSGYLLRSVGDNEILVTNLGKN